MGISIKRTAKGVKLRGYLYPGTIRSPEQEASRHFNRIRRARVLLGMDADPEETSRHRLIYQEREDD